MALSALDDLSARPTDQQVDAVLGSSLEAWRSLASWLTDAAGVDTWEWGSSGKRYGWALRAKAGRRTIAYLIPQHGTFLVGLVLGDRAMTAARQAALAASVRAVIDSAPRYAEGTGFRIPVGSTAELGDVRTLIEAKLQP